MKIRGFSVKQRAGKVFRRILRRRSRSSPAAYQRLDCQPKKCSVFTLFSSFLGRSKPAPEKSPATAAAAPKGYLAVYVGGERDGEFRRVMVPVVYFNHPLFGELLKEAENEFGFAHPGGIQIPCRVSEFERVRTRIRQGRRLVGHQRSIHVK